MNLNTLLPVRSAIKQALREARVARPRSTASVIAVLALSATALSPQARSGDYDASTEQQLRDAITAANGDPDPSATITLTNNVTMASTTAFPTATKPVTLNTGSFTLSGFDQTSGTAAGGSLIFSGVTIVNSGNLVGGDAFAATTTTNGQGGIGLSLTNGSLTNNGAITGGNGGTNPGIGASPGGVGVALTGGSHVNKGTISGGVGGLSSGDGTRAGGGGLTLSNGSLTNSGTIQAGPATGNVSSGTAVALSGTTTLDNSGMIRGGMGGLPVSSTSNAGLSVSGSATVTNTGTIEGGVGGPAIAVNPFGSHSLTLVNSGTVRSGGTGAAAIQFNSSGGATVVLELHPGSVIEGTVIAGVANANDVLRLGGAGSDSFDVSAIGSPGAQYRQFSVFQKNGTSIWTLTGTTTALTPWRLLGGTLSVSQDGSLGSAAGALTFDTGALRSTSAFTSARTVTLNAGGGTFDTAADLTWSGVIGGAGALTKIGSGALILTANNVYTGATNVNAGTLRVNGNQSAVTGLTTVASGGTLGGSGTIGGAVTVADGGHLAPGNSPGTLNMGALTLSAGSVLDFELGAANVAGGALNDLINVTGDLVLDGTLNVTPSAGGTFGVGVYRLINYTGNLTDHGLDIGLVPAGSSNYIQTSFANQVNLINTQGLALNYWDGAADARSNAVVGGGTGTWQAATGNDNWTTADGSINAGYANGAFAIFAGSAGTVAVDGSKGDVRVAGMQFATDGYRIEGDALTLATGLNSVRVGDGTNAGSVFKATIASTLVGDGTLDKTDLGTLVLTGENTYTGNTKVSAGTLQIGDGGSSGSILGNVTNEGLLAFNRSDNVGFAGVISGGGTLTQIGAGSTTLTGVNTYTGVTTIASGTLALGSAGSIAASSGVVDEAIFDISASDSGASITTLSGSGSVVLGSKALTLTAPTATFAGVVDGAAGTLNKGGSGTWTLAGAGSRVGTLNVQTGALELATGASVAAQSTTVSAGATLRNNGTLTGTAGSDTFALAGTFIGNASFLDGDDQLQIADGANYAQATFDGGAGIDTLDITSSGSLTPPAAATGFERLVKRGSGLLTLSGTVDAFHDAITIAGGTANLSQATVNTADFRIDFGATVTGSGSLSGNLINAGVLSPGNSAGSIHVGGNYTQAASGTLVSEILRTGSDRIDISGAAALAGTQQIHIEYGLYLDGTTHTLLQAAGGISGDFDSVQMNQSALMPANRQLSANAETVTFKRQSFTSTTDPQSGRGRFASWLEEQVGGGSLTPQMTDYIDLLLQQPTAQGAAALLGDRGEPVASVTQNSVSILGAGFARSVFERFTESDAAQCAPTQASSNDTLNCFWAHGVRQWGNVAGDARYDWTTDGGQFGIDRDLASGWAVGATFGYADTENRDQAGGTDDVRSKMGGLYANYSAERLNAGVMAFYSGNRNDTRRNVLIGTSVQQARAEFDSDSYGAGVRVGYRVTRDSEPLVRPFVEAFYDHAKPTELSETGADAGNLRSHVYGRDGLRGTVGLQLADNFEGYGRVFRPALEVGVAHQFGDVRSMMDLQPFSDAPAFRTYGPALDRTAYLARASLNVSLGANASIAVGYGGEVGEDYSQHEGNLSFRVSW